MLTISLVTLISILAVQANILYCLNDGENLPPGCSGGDCRYTCDLTSGSGFCQVCTTDNGFPGVNPATCFGQTCSFLNDPDDDIVDPNPVQMTINAPVEGSVYATRRVPFDVILDAFSRLEYKANDDTSWHKLCDNCRSYNRDVRLDEGFNEVTIRAKKLSNNMITEDAVTLSVDSRNPDFRNSWPDNGEFANGEFTVEYTEENLRKVELRYKGVNEENWNTVEVPGCQSGERMTCSTNLNLNAYENGQLEYQFSICDHAICDDGAIKVVEVDSTAPFITLEQFFASGYSDNKIPFIIDVNEGVDLFWVDNNDNKDPPKRNKLCSDCDFFSGEKNFKDGEWDITIFAEDDAGNFDSFDVHFFVDTKKPKIHKQIPYTGWANGEFTVEYTETQVASVTLYYGSDGNYQTVTLNNCESGKRQQCSLVVDLSQYDGSTVDTYFAVSDNYFSVSSKVRTFDVDVTDPVFTQVAFNVNEDEVLFDLLVSEVVDVEYMDSADSRPKFKNLCRNKDICDVEKRFREGAHTLTLRAIDDAGNFDEEVINFAI